MMRTLGTTSLKVFPLCLGGNVFGWTADEAASFDVLDAYSGAGGNFVDTADTYSSWVPGNAGGESETILGRWMASRKNRARIVVATKVGQHPSFPGLSGKNVRAAAEASLKRLGTDVIDLYYAHRDDLSAPLEETVRAFDALVKEGKVRFVAASNYAAPRLAEALAIAKSAGLSTFVALQPQYNLMDRAAYERDLAPLCAREKLACLPYYALARGFLTGKYRDGKKVESARAAGASAYSNERGLRVLAALDAIAAEHRTTVAAVALAWLAARPTVTSVLASARTRGQLDEILPMATLDLSAEEHRRLESASATVD
jgi:aryl-alcohol dehydrogenase-like predicted oxidoreductase